MLSDTLPRGGPDATWWDRLYETDRTEWIDLIDQPGATARARRGLDGLARFQRLSRAYRTFSRLTLAQVGHLDEPRILELGAGRGHLAQHLLRDHPRAHVTFSDLSPDSVRAFRSGPLADHPRVASQILDATEMDVPEGSWDVAVFAMSLHHLQPAQVRMVLSEGTRVAHKLLIVDAWRNPALLSVVPLLLLVGGACTAHDGVISLRKAYSPSALRALARHGAAPIRVDCRFQLPGYLVATAERARKTPNLEGSGTNSALRSPMP
ncbi:class I SAM-dependent methyltransferase [Streptomyces sp. NPDC127068]|uniref:class I SAM-dependent methyltransferase n=1 Tax=Streptomyces sp. NPDC127068 TaxID=3347127 RepID=UPI00365D11EC